MKEGEREKMAKEEEGGSKGRARLQMGKRKIIAEGNNKCEDAVTILSPLI